MTATIKRRLGPLRPVLRPIWHVFQALVRRDSRVSVPYLVERTAHRAERLVRRILGRTPPIRALDRVELLDLAASVPYYQARRGYLGVAATIAADLIDRRRLRTALELGPHLRSLIVGADIMDIASEPDLQAEGRRITHNAMQSPWPIADKAYDLFVAFQVFEHLGAHQPAAFREVRRVARHAILSLPIDWDMADATNCHYMISEETVLGWFAPVVPTRIVVGNPGHRKRLMFVFEDLPAPEEPAAGDAPRADAALPPA
jgi:hypothetical protein